MSDSKRDAAAVTSRNLRRLLKYRGWSQTDLASRLAANSGVKWASISWTEASRWRVKINAWYHGKACMPVPAILDVAKIGKVRPSYFLE